ncbi:MAG: biopolymer transporter ExbD [Phycisphaeraceae bacterium]
MSRVTKRGPAKAEMNMTPMIDVTFQLIIFFLLVNNIATDQLVEMRVPNLDDPKVIELGDIPKIIVSIKPPDNLVRDPSDPLKIPGDAQKVRVGTEDFNIDNLAGITDSLKKAKAQNPEVEVLLRADSGTMYENIAPVMQAITAAQISKLNLVAYLPGQSPD